MKYREGSLSVYLSWHLMQTGMAYRTDLHLLGRGMVSETRVSQVISKMLADGVVIERMVQGTMPKAESAVALSRNGRVALLDYLDNEFWYEHSTDALQAFRTSNEKVIVEKLNDVKIVTAMKAAGVSCYKCEKPSLITLYEQMSGIPVEHAEFTWEPLYLPPAPRAEIEKLFENGIYYTMREVREFYDLILMGATDPFLGTKARGIFISRNTFAVVYAGIHQNNRLLRISRTSELRLIDALQKLLAITNASRNYTNFPVPANEMVTASPAPATNRIWAIVMSDGDSLAYSMATGNPRGIIRGVDKMKRDEEKKKYLTDSGRSENKSWLKGNSDIYKRTFVTPFTVSGVRSLKYILHTFPEEWYNQAKSLANEFEGVTMTQDPVYPGLFNGIPMVFMPAYEVNELYNMSSSKINSYIIFSYPDMYECISHSIRKRADYINADTLQIDSKKVGIYDKNGELRGKVILEEHLLSNGYEMTKVTYQNFPKKIGYTARELYNGIADKTIDIIDIETKAMDYCTELQLKEKKRIRRKSITLTMGEEFTNDIYTASRLYNMSASAYIKNLIHERVTQDATAYKEKLANEKQIRRKEYA